MKYIKIVLWTLVIAYLCFSPADGLKKVIIPIPHFDKVVHFGMFFIAGILIEALNYFHPSRLHKIGLPLLFVVYAAFTEIIQFYFIYNRKGDIIDCLADILGIIVGVITFRIIPIKIRRLLS